MLDKKYTPLPDYKDLHELFLYDYTTGEMFRKKTVSSNAKFLDSQQSVDSKGYRRIQINKKRYRMHRIAWKMFYGRDPLMDLDHINRNRIDNRIENLREATQSQNNINASLRSDNNSGHKGVCYDQDRGKWMAYTSENKKTKFLGRFKNKQEAINARKEAEQCLN